MILASPTYKRFEECVDMIISAYSGTVTPEHTIIYDNSVGGFINYLRANKVEIPEIEIIIPPKNDGCAISWNKMIKRAYELNPNTHVIVSNDDIGFEKDTIELFERAILENPNELMYVCGGIASPNAFSLFATRYDKMQESVGMFDEMFLYPYLEDGDYARRMMLAGLKLYRIPSASANHIGSATIQAYDEEEMLKHHIKFSRNVMYFEMKWGIADHNNWMSQDGFIEAFQGDKQYQEIVYSTIRNVYGE